ncbi:hypothetical protein [Micromonospora haikouensis]|uniref:hypothetical protein n=1 Tax=Micromonospora haikouensis TaxID=686309 RepID=UPI003D73F944
MTAPRRRHARRRPACDDAVRPAGWDDGDFLLRATGRVPLTDRERWELGEAAGWFPLIG